jgi:iron complex outermembrane receptor protein
MQFSRPHAFERALAAWLVGGTAVFAQQNASTSEPPQPVQLSPFEVSEEKDRGYGTTHSVGSTRINVPIQDIPISILTINQEMVQDSAPLDAVDTLRYVAGVTRAASSIAGQFTLRGYNLNGIDIMDGIPDPGTGQRVDPATIERVELIKGPVGTLYGSHTLGGIVNRISKKPLAQRRHHVELMLGSFDLHRVEFDATGAAPQRGEGPGQLLYRLVAAHQDGGVFWGGMNDRFTVVPMLTYRFNNDTQVSTRFDYSHSEISTSTTQFVADVTGIISTFLPYEGNLGEFDERNEDWAYRYEVALEHHIDAQKTFRLTARYGRNDGSQTVYPVVRLDFVNAAGQALRNAANQVAHSNNTSFAEAFAHPQFADMRMLRQRRRDFTRQESGLVVADFAAGFDLGPTRHQSLLYTTAGLNESRNERYLWGYDNDISAFNVVPFPHGDPAAHATGRTTAIDTAGDSHTFSAGLQDSMSLLRNRVVASWGTRYDWSQGNGIDFRNGADSRTKNHDWSHRLGLVGKPREGVALFYNYSETFNPVSGVDDFGRPFRNQRGTSNEPGVKLELMERRLNVTASYFEIELDGVIRTILSTDPATIGQPVREQSGVNQTEGFELDVAWQPTDALSFFGGYQDVESSETLANGNTVRTRNVGQGENYSFFGKYTFLTGALKGVSLGTGYRFINERAGDAQDSFTLPSYETWDLLASYQRKNWRLQLNVRNLTDEKYIESSVLTRFIFAGDPRNYRVSLGYRF